MITILSDNRTAEPGVFRTEHGLAVLLQTSTRQLLLDTGASGLFVHNARRLGLDLSGIDYVFLSHGHADHAGGLSAFLQGNSRAQVIVSPEAVEGRFYSDRGGLHCISPEWPVGQMKDRTLYVGESQSITAGIHVIARIPQTHPLPAGDRHLLAGRDGGYVPDDFRHELALYVDGLLFTGCAHSGLENILDACPWPVHTVLGGFHLLDARDGESYESAEELEALGARLKARCPDTIFYTSHCTGDIAFQTLRNALGDNLRHFSCGMLIGTPLD
ncbi:MAG: MBL fold metallo-hydrolase [Bacteroidales bacterium]|nr:MBL fold metallo-hydrolase [Bacteroidales bacterium]